jgi:hypothetical protein
MKAILILFLFSFLLIFSSCYKETIMVNPSDLDSTRLADAIKERENNKQRTQ